nr:LamB/YcsF family protein [Nocardioides convexus]
MRLPRRRPAHPGPHLRARRRARRRDRRPGGLPRPRRLREAVRRRTGRGAWRRTCSTRLGALDGIARAAGARVAYVKPHGALYHAVSRHPEQAAAVVRAVVAFGGLPVLGLAGSDFLAAVAGAGLAAVGEGFADRGYLPGGGLVPRSEPGALLLDPAEVAAQAVRLARSGVRSLCVHGDSPGAPGLAAAVRAALDAAGVAVAPFA